MNVIQESQIGFKKFIRGDGGGFLELGPADGGTVVILKSSIVAGNKKGTSGTTDATADCEGTINSQGYNLTGNGTGCNLGATGDVTVNLANVFTDVLGTLGSNCVVWITSLIQLIGVMYEPGCRLHNDQRHWHLHGHIRSGRRCKL